MHLRACVTWCVLLCVWWWWGGGLCVFDFIVTRSHPLCISRCQHPTCPCPCPGHCQSVLYSEQVLTLYFVPATAAGHGYAGLQPLCRLHPGRGQPNLLLGFRQGLWLFVGGRGGGQPVLFALAPTLHRNTAYGLRILHTGTYRLCTPVRTDSVHTGTTVLGVIVKSKRAPARLPPWLVAVGQV